MEGIAKNTSFQQKERPFPTLNSAATSFNKSCSKWNSLLPVWSCRCHLTTASQSETSSWNWTGHLNGTCCLYMKNLFSVTSTIQNFKTRSDTSLKTQSEVGCKKKYASWSSPRLACECRYDFHNGRHDSALLMKVQETALAEPRNRICYYK